MRIAHQVGAEEVLSRQDSLRREGDGARSPILSIYFSTQRITSSEDVLPIFLISSLTGKNINLLSSFLNLLTSASELKDNEDLSTEFSISDKYVVDGNLILAGTVIKGSIKRGQMLHIGPDLKGSFRAVEITSI